MRAVVIGGKRRQTMTVLLGCVLVGAMLLCYPQASASGVSRGLALCGQLLIPSLFPFLVLSSFLVRSGLTAAVSRRLSPLTNRLLGLPGCAATALALSVCGGYPAGAAAVAELVNGGQLDKTDAKRLLRCCVCGGPAFLVCGVGVGMCGSVKAGVLLLAAHLAAALVVLLLSRQTNTPEKKSAAVSPLPLSVGAAFADSVHAACEAILSVCGFVLLSCAVLSLLDASGGQAALEQLLAAPFHALGKQPTALKALLPSLLEVSCGCVEAAACGDAAPFLLGFALGFGGLSVHGQVAAATRGLALLDGAYFRARLLHGFLGGCFSALLFWWLPVAPTASVASVAPIASAAPIASVAPVISAAFSDLPTSAPLGTLALLSVCVLFLCAIPQGPHALQE